MEKTPTTATSALPPPSRRWRNWRRPCPCSAFVRSLPAHKNWWIVEKILDGVYAIYKNWDKLGAFTLTFLRIANIIYPIGWDNRVSLFLSNS